MKRSLTMRFLLLEPIEVARGYEIVSDFYRTRDEYAELLTVDKFMQSDAYKEWFEEYKKNYDIEITDPAMKAFRLLHVRHTNLPRIGPDLLKLANWQLKKILISLIIICRNNTYFLDLIRKRCRKNRPEISGNI